MKAIRRRLRRGELPEDHPTAMAFLDESGTIARDRFFAVGCLKATNPDILLRTITAFRDRRHWYKEIHFSDLTRGSAGLYKDVIDVVAACPGLSFTCFVADRNVNDPVARFGESWKAYEKLATQLLIGSIKPWELVSVLADNYSTPSTVTFEQRLKAETNRRLGRLAITTVCRLDSRSSDPLQVVDLLTSAVTFEFRQSARLAGATTPKADVAKHFRSTFGIHTSLGGVRTNLINVAIYEERSKEGGA